MRAGSNAIKIEGAAGQLDLMAHVVESGVPVMGHLGLTPQSVEAFGGHKVQVVPKRLRKKSWPTPRRWNKPVVLPGAECIPQMLGRKITQALSIPTIGIGAGPFTDGPGISAARPAGNAGGL